MILVILTALAAVCGAAKLDQSYLPPISARTAGGSAGALLAPLDGSNQGLPTGSFTNDVQGVVVDAVNPGTRTSGHEPTGLGGPRTSYGSTDSKVGNAAFSGSSLGSVGANTRIAPGFGSFVESDGAQTDKTRGNTLKFSSDVGLENYSYGFETDNGIAVGENGEAANGVKAQGGYSYKGDDGKTYSVSYTADEGGYKPQGQHLPTPPPIPSEILVSLEKNAKEEAAGHVDDGSYDAQKYNDEGDYSSNGAGNNNGRPTIGGGVATSGGSYVSQSSHRPTSGVLVGTYNPNSVASYSSQGNNVQGLSQYSGNKQSGGSSSIGGQFGQTGSKESNSLSYGSSSQGAQSGFSSPSTENRFGVQPSKSGGNNAHAQVSAGGSPVRSPSFHNSASAYSSAITTGSGSASAFASSGPLSSGFKNDNFPSLNSFGSAGQHTHGSDSSAGASFPAPSTATASASASGNQTPGSHAQSYSPNLPSSASASASVSGNQHSYGHSNQQVPNRFGEGQQAGNSATNGEHLSPVNKIEPTGKPYGFDSSSAASAANVQPLSQHSSQSQFVNYQSSNQASHSFGSSPTPATSVSSTHTGAVDATYVSSTQKPLISQHQGIDDSYFYNHPAKPFVTPSVSSSSQYANNNQPKFPVSSISQQGSKYPTTSATGQYHGTGSPSYNGITQAAISPFTSSSSSAQFASQSSQFDSKPSAQFSQSGQQTFTQYGSTEIHAGHKPTVQGQTQFGQSGQQLTSSQFGSTETHSGDKPIVQGQTQFSQSGQQTTSTQFGSTGTHSGHKPTGQGQIQFGQPGQQTSTQFGSTETHSGHKPTVQSQTQFGQSSTSQTSDSSQSPTQQYQGTIYQYNKPATTLPAQGNKDHSSSFAQATFSQTKPGQIETDSRFGTQQGSSQFGSQSTFQQTQTGYNAQTSQFGLKPIVSSQGTGSNYQFGSSGSQFGQKPLTTQGSVVSSNTNTQSQTSFGQKPVGSSLTTQFGSTGSQFGSKPEKTQGSSYALSQSQTSQFGKRPVSTTQTGVTSQQTQFGSTDSQFGQNSQLTANLVSTTAKPSYGQKPSGSSYQQTQFGSSGSQFGSKPQKTQDSGFAYTQSQTSQFEKKPVTTQTGSQFGQNLQSTHGSGLTSTTSQTSFGIKPVYQQAQLGQTSQFEKKPITTNQTGATSQQTHFGSTGFQFGQNSPSTQGSGTVSTTTKPSYGQKPSGSTYQQTQFGSAGSQFGSKPTQGSSFTYSQATSQTPQFGKKPVSTINTGVTSQQNQFESSGNKLGQNSQSTQGSSLALTTSQPSLGQKPFGSSYQQTQFGSTGSQYGQNAQSTPGSGPGTTTTLPSYSQKPFGTSYQQTQFVSKPQITQSSSFASSQASSQTSQFGKKPENTIQTGATSQQTQFGSSASQFGQNSQFGSYGSQFGQNSQFGSSGSQFGQNSHFGSSGFQFGQNAQNTVGAGSVSTTTKPSFSQKPFGSTYQQTQFGSKPLPTQQSTYSQATSQTSQFGKKPVSTTQTGATSQQTQFGSASAQFGQHSQSIQGSGLAFTTSKPSYGQKPFGSSYQQTQFGSSSPQFGQNTQSTQGSGSVLTTSKPSFGSSSQQTQFGSQFGQKPQSTSSSFTSNTQTQTSQFGKKPESSQTGSAFQQTQFGSTGSQFGQKPLTTSVTGVTSTTGQASFGQKPSSQTQGGSFYQQSQFGSTGSQFGQKPQSATQGSSYASNTGSKGQVTQTSQFGVIGSPQNIGSSSQSTQYGSASGSGNKLSGSSSASGSNFQQTQFAGTSASQFGQTTQATQGIISQAKPVHTTQYGIKPFGSPQNTQGSTQFGSTPSRFGESSQTSVPTITTISQTAQPTQFGQKPFQTQFGSTAGHFGQKPQAQASSFASSSGSNVVPFGSTQTVSKYQQNSQFGSQNQGVVTSTPKPLGSSLSQTNYQQFQYTQTAEKSGSLPQHGQASQSNVGTGQIGQTTFGVQSQKPFGSQSTQTTYQQTQFTQGQKPLGSSQGSGFQIGQSTGDQPTQGTVQTTSVAGYNYQKPQSVFTTQYGGQGNGPQVQKVQQTQSNFNSAVSTSQIPIKGQPLKPFEISSTQGTFQQSTSPVSSSQLGAQPAKPTEFNGPVIQTSYNQFSGKPFQPASTTSTHGSNVQSQSSAFSTSQFGLQPTQPAAIAHFSGQPFGSSSTHGSSLGSQTAVGSTPEYSIHPSHGVVVTTQNPSHFSVEPYNPSVFSSAQASSVPSGVGSKEGLVVSTVQTPIVPVPGYEIVTSNHGAAHGLIGLGEAFGGPRDPPRFDDKTGYHY